MASRFQVLAAIVMGLALAAAILVGGCSAPGPSGQTGPEPTVGATASAIGSAALPASPTLPPTATVPPTATPPPTATALPTAVPTVPAIVPTAAGARAPAPVPAEPGLVTRVAKAVRPAVVSITTEQTVRDLWRDQSYSQETGSGSGVIFDKQGYIVTNHHVVADGERLKVSLPDGRSFEGQLVGSDSYSDLAVVRIQGDNLPVAPLGDSDALEIGEWVVAIGNALDLPGGPTVTAGVVGALGRSLEEAAADGSTVLLYDLIQTDAAINPGNSGGPLVNMRGEVIGINTAIAGEVSSGLPAQGIGYAIAMNTARPVLDQIIATGKMVWPSLGISFRALTPAVAAMQQLPVKRGIAILALASGGPAARAGLQRGDIIVQIAGDTVEDEVTFLKAVRKHRPGDKVAVTAVRGTDKATYEVTLGQVMD